MPNWIPPSNAEVSKDNQGWTPPDNAVPVDLKKKVQLSEPSTSLKESESVSTSTSQTNDLFEIKDSRSIDYASGTKIGDRNNLSSKVKYGTLKNIINEAKSQGVDPYTALAVAMQESRMGEETGDNPFSIDYNVHKDLSKRAANEDEVKLGVELLKKKIDEGRRRGKKTEEEIIQAWNGYGKLGSTKENIGNKAYGIDISKNPIDMSKNPIYGKKIIDLRENVLKKNPDIRRLIESTSTLQTEDIAMPTMEIAGDVGIKSGETTAQPSQQGKGLKTVKQVKEEGGKPTFENYAASALSGIGGYVGEHGAQIAEGLIKAGESVAKIATEAVSPVQKPIAEKIKAQAHNGLDALLGGAESAFGAISFTPTGAAFNVAAETIIPEKVNEWLFAPAHKIAEQFGYEPKDHEGELGEKALQVADIVGSLFTMKGAEIGAKKGYGLATDQYTAIKEKLSKKEPLTQEESKLVSDVVADTKPEELREAVKENEDVLKPLWLDKNKVVDVVEKSLEGKDVKKDIAKLDTDKENFNQVVDLAKEADHIDEAKAIQLKTDFDNIQKAKAKVPEEFVGNYKIVSLIAEKDNLRESKNNVDESFHPEIDAKIEKINERIQEQKSKQNEKVKQEKEAPTEGGVLRLEDERNAFIQEKISKFTDPLAIEKGKIVYGEMFDKQQALKELVPPKEKEKFEEAEQKAAELVGEPPIIETLKTETDGSIPVRSSEEILIQEPPRDSGEVVEGISESKEPSGARSEQEGIEKESEPSVEVKEEIKPTEEQIEKQKEEFKVVKNTVFPKAVEKVKKVVEDIGKIFYPEKYMAKSIGQDVSAETMQRLLSPDYVMEKFRETEIKEADQTVGELSDFFRKNYSKEELMDANRAYGDPLTPEGKKIKGLALERLNETEKGKELIYFNENIRGKISDAAFDLAQELGFNDMSHFKDYFYGVYEGSASAKDAVMKKLAEEKLKEETHYKTTERFKKEKTIASIADAEGYGLPLKTINPIDNIATEVYAIGKRASLKSIKDDLWLNSRPFSIKASQATPEIAETWKPINDPLFEGDLFHPDFARVVNNFIEVNALSKNKATKALRGLVMASQGVKFFGSAFHLFNELKASIASGGAIGARDFGKSFFKKIDKKDPDYYEYIKNGGGIHYSKETEAIKKFSDMYDNVVKTALFNNPAAKAIGVPVKFMMGKYNPVSPAFAKAMFNDWIPAMKFERFKADKAKLEQNLGRPLKAKELQMLVKRQQEFFGEMNEKLYGRSGTVTAIMRLFFMAPGYAEGNFMHQYRGVKEVKDVAVAATKGEGKKQMKEVGVKNAAFVANSLMTTAVMATIGTYLMTGKWPKKPEDANDVRDLFKIKTGQKDGNGDDMFVDMMTYDKDAWMLFGNLGSGHPGKIGEEIPQRLYGMESAPFKTAVDLGVILSGGVVYDFKGDPIYHAKDDLHTKFWKFMAYEGQKAEPISLSTYRQSREKGTDVPSALLQSVGGFRPTTSEAVKETKKSIRDDYSLRDAKRNEIQRLNKIHSTNPEEAEKQAKEFNDTQESNLRQLFVKEYENINKKEPTEQYIEKKLKRVERGMYYITEFKDKKKKKGTSLNIEKSKKAGGKPKKIK